MSITTNPLGQWIATTNLPVNNQLLNAAKSLLRGIYTDSGGADYLPTTYTNCNPMLTQYLTHASHQTGVNWPDQFSWASQPGARTPDGHSSFSGSVVAGEQRSGAYCWTDCSGFITALFAWVNSKTMSATVFPYWATGQQIPEAGCFAKDHSAGTGDETWPNALNFYHLTNQAASTTPPNQFQSIALEDITPGDLVVFAKGNADAGDTGHIMLIAAIMPVVFGGEYTICGQDLTISAKEASASASTPRLLVVIDQTQDPHRPHIPPGQQWQDSRGDGNQKEGNGVGIGVGMGLILLYMDGGKIQFRWSTNGNLETVNGGAVVLARAQAVTA